MRLWTVHPRYLDARGLVALWREALLAQKVLRGETRGYRHHPQLHRFVSQPDPAAAIGAYLEVVHAEAVNRGYRFDPEKIGTVGPAPSIPANHGQLLYEWRHLLAKLQVRDPARLNEHAGIDLPEVHPLFRVVEGPVEAWERV